MRMVIGCSQLSNCAARTRYMKTPEERKASRKALAARPCSLERPVRPYEYPVGRLMDRGRGVQGLDDRLLREPGLRLHGDQDLTRAADPVHHRRALRLIDAHQVAQAHGAEAGRGNAGLGDGRGRSPVDALGPDPHVVALAASRSSRSP